MITAWEKYWWNNITGPHEVVSHVVDGLIHKKNVVLLVPQDLPWRHEMRNCTQDLFAQRMGYWEGNIVTLDAADDPEAMLDPGRYLLDNYASSSVRNSYRSKSKQTIQNHLINNGVLKNMIIWIKGLTRPQADKWIEFCRGYIAHEFLDGLIVLECPSAVSFTDAKAIVRVDYNQHVQSYDLQLFNSILLDSQPHCSNLWKQYIASLAAQLCQTDAEVSEQFIRLSDFTKEEPLTSLEKVLDCGGFDLRGAADNSSHILGLVRQEEIDTINQRIWAAQLQVLFPQIELHRLQIISMLYDQLADCLKKEHIEQFGQVLTDPKDIELGTLIYMMARYDDEGYRFVNIPDEQLRNDIHFLRECRNTLAHSGVCPVDAVNRLLNFTTYS